MNKMVGNWMLNESSCSIRPKDRSVSHRDHSNAMCQLLLQSNKMLPAERQQRLGARIRIRIWADTKTIY